ncbi:MAG: hypothetical protein DRJ40_09890 [Thermoprotei archaeon]|nr:MAG: hypothetical protein DRJ40_09890 [Thermoprotei archaeon]
MYTTHVGSFPLDFTRDNVLRVFHDMINIGIDYPPYPQLRNFIKIFLDPLVDIHVLKLVNSKYVINISLSELKNLPLPAVRLEEAEIVASIVKKERICVEAIRGCVTGPFTLASEIQISERETRGLFTSALSSKDFVLKYMTRIVREFVTYLHDVLGFKFIVIDEPVLSVIVGSRRILFDYTIEEISKCLDEVLQGVELAGVHVCGRVPPLLKDVLLSTRYVKVLDHEFKDNPKNLTVYTKDELEKYDKFISFGCVSSRKPVIESVEEIMDVVKRGIDTFGSRLLMIKPDCGFRGLAGFFENKEKAYEVAIEKLRRIVEVKRRLHV